MSTSFRFDAALHECAPAKINLALHVTGRRADGYHLLDSIVAFCDIGDRLHAHPSAQEALELAGPFGAELPKGGDNLVLRAARAQARGQSFAFRLEKHLPPASGIGGGSADAAAAIRLVQRALPEAVPLSPAEVLALGADVPVCLHGQTARMSGIGEQIEQLSPLPDCAILLVNPRIEVSTPKVFSALQSRDNPALPAQIPAFRDAQALAGWLQTQRNDLEPPARSIAPVIDEVLCAIEGATGQLLARMSRSGATCFGLFAGKAQAQTAAEQLRAEHPDWWIASGSLL